VDSALNNRSKKEQLGFNASLGLGGGEEALWMEGNCRRELRRSGTGGLMEPASSMHPTSWLEGRSGATMLQGWEALRVAQPTAKRDVEEETPVACGKRRTGR